MPTILYPPTIDYAYMFQRPQQLMTQFSRHGWTVYYCNKTQQKGKPVQSVAPNLFIVHDFDAFIKQHTPVDVLWISWAGHYNVSIKSRLVAFDALDDFELWRQFDEPMVQRADVIFTTSIKLYDKYKAIVKSYGKEVVYVRNGCDLRLLDYVSKRVPPELTNLRRPIVGFVGALGYWVDVTLIERVAREFSMVVIGPPFGNAPPRNVVYAGMKPYSELADYYNAIDVGIIPFLINDVSIAADPIKMYEYMLFGKPVVTTDIPQCHGFPGAVFPSKTYDEFLENIWRVTQSYDAMLSRQYALSCTWASRFEQIERVLKGYLK